MYPPLFKTNFTGSDGIDLGEKFISKDYLLSSYPNLLDNILTSSLFLWGSLSTSPLNSSISIPQISSALFGKVRQISASKWDTLNGTREYHVAAITSDGSLYVAGANSYGQLGLGDVNSRSNFTRVGTETDWKQVYCGSVCTIAIKTDGSLWAAGNNNDYQLGLGDKVRRTSFSRVGSDNDWKYACIGSRHGVGIKENGTLWTWGTNTSGLLGISSSDQTTVSTVPNLINNDTWNYIDTSTTVSCAIKYDGSMWIWGRSDDFNSTSINYIVPNQISNDRWKMVSIGYNHASAIKMDGTLWSIGNNTLGNLGINNNSITSSSTFLQISGGGFWKQVASGNFFGIAIRADGTLWSWGNSRNGQLGRGIINEENNFIGQVEGYWSQVCCSAFASMAIKTFDYD